MNSYQLWLRLTYWLRNEPAIYIPTQMDIVAVVILLFFIKRFREMRTPLVWMYALVLLHAFILPYSFTLGLGGLFLLFPFFTFWGPGFFICFLFCQAAASRIEKTGENRELLHVGAFFFALYLLLHIIFVLGGC